MSPLEDRYDPSVAAERSFRRLSVNVRFILIAIIALAGMPATLAAASEPTPVGKWKTIDDKTGEAGSFVQIYEENGKLLGKIESLVPKAGENPNPKCDKCDGERKGKSVLGMVFLWDLKQEKSNTWGGGRILDPSSGSIYRCTLKLLEDGTKLEVRGYIGISLLGRSQEWYRVE
jgi:uncharacterized protein (DUF2147 family)